MPSHGRDRIRNAVSTGLRSRITLLLVVMLPLLAGAVNAGLAPMFDASGRLPKVAVVEPEAKQAGSAASRLADAITRSADFDWQLSTTDDAAAGLTDGSLLAAVTIPDTFGATTVTADPDSRRVTITPGRGDAGTAIYAGLVQAVSASASKVGVNDLLVSVSKARNDLTQAQSSAYLIKAAAGQADEAFVSAFDSVDKLVRQTDPMLQNAQSLLTTIHRTQASVTDIADKLTAFANGVRGINLTIGDIQNGAKIVGQGADSTSKAIRDTESLRAKVRTIVAPIANSLHTSDIPDGRRMAEQLDSLLLLIGGPSDRQLDANLGGVRSGAQLLAAQLNDLSGLLGAPVDGRSQISEVLRLGADRLRTLGTFLGQGDQTINQVLGQVSQAKGQLPALQANIREQLERFKKITAQLAASLEAGTSALPVAGAAKTSAIGDPVRLSDAAAGSDGLADENLTRAVLLLQAGALLIALLRPWSSERMRRSGSTRRTTSIVTTACSAILGVGLAAAGSAVLGSVPRPDAAFAVLALAALALTALSVAVLRMLGDKAGLLVLVAIIGATAVFGGGIHSEGHNAVADVIRRLLPGSYAMTGLGDAAASGIGSPTLPIVVLTAVGLLSVVGYLVASRRTREPVSR